MIGRLRGKLIAEEVDGTIVVDVRGVGYDLSVPLGTLGRVSSDDTGDIHLFVHTHVREDAFSLFGFASDAERTAFRLLLAVPNVGPRTALAILSALPVDALARAVAAGDLATLTKVPGIGKRTGEVLLVQLRDKLPTPTSRDVGSPQRSATPRPSSSQTETVVRALTGLGYRSADAERAVAALDGTVLQRPMADILREALTRLAK